MSHTPQKVVLLITKANWGGAQRHVYDIATRLDPHDYDVVVVTGGTGELTTMLDHARIRVRTLNHLVRDISLNDEWRAWRELLEVLKEERPDILHVHSSKAGIFGVLAGRILGISRVLFTAHGWAFNEDRPFWQKLCIGFIHYLTVLLSHRTIAVSRALLYQLPLPYVEQKMKVVHPGRTVGVMYSMDEARQHIHEIANLPPQASNLYWIGTIGELHPIKRQRILIAAFAQFHSAHPQSLLFIIGEGSERASLTKQIETLGLSHTVILLGHMTDAARYLKAFDLFVLPSKSESYGYAAHEAGLAGLPVIASNVGGLPEIITHKHSGLLVQPDDVIDLCTAMETLFQNPATAHMYATNLKESMDERDVTKMVTALHVLYTT